MEKVFLGSTGLHVSRLCFGVLPMGPLQMRIPLAEGRDLLLDAFHQGINFLDTAESYQTYPYIREALKRFPGRIIVATKSPAVEYGEMEKSIHGALEELALKTIDIFHLHAAKRKDPLTERGGALQCLIDYKKRGIIQAVGLASHSCSAVGAAAEHDDIDVIFPLINKEGLGIMHGSVEDMLQAIQRAHKRGKGTYAMKVLGGGNLIDDVPEAFHFVLKNGAIHSVAVGMINSGELQVNCRLFAGEVVSPEELERLRRKKKLIIAKKLCIGCGECLQACPSGALSLGEKVVVDEEACILCGYCYPICPQFAIRMV